MLKLLSRLIGISLIIGLALPAAAQPPDLGPVPAPGTREIFVVLAYGDPVFESSWYLDASQNNTDRTTAAWYNDRLGALVFFSLLHFPGGTSAAELPDYFDDAYFQIVLENYTPYLLKTTCTADGVTLRIFNAVNNDLPYLVYYYDRLAPAVDRALVGASDRVLTVQFSFPVTERAQLLRYTGALFPQLPDC